MRKRLTGAAGLALSGLLLACSGTPGTTSAPTLAPVPSIAVPSFELPSFSIPSFAPDPVIEAAFPEQIGGQPVEDISSASFLAVLQAFGRQQEDIDAFASGMQSIGVDPASVGFGSGSATVEGESVDIQVARFPGGNAATALDILIRLDEPDETPNITPATIGGKNATVATFSDGSTEYFYVNGEWAWFLSDVEQSQAEVVFAALP